MLIPVAWLEEFVRVEADAAALAERLTLTGNEIEEIRESGIGPVLHLKLTPNRGDMLSIRGAAREVAAIYDLVYREPEIPALPARTAGEGSGLRVEVAAPDLCPRYTARVIRGVRVGPSPDWLRERLEAVGLRAISNVVDVTNYVMWELGHPLHAFDLALLRGPAILVRRATPGERMTAIDGTELELAPDDLVIADAERPVALAGIMGGRDTEVSDATTDVLLEAASFDPAGVRRSSRRCGLASPSSYRFERGVDATGVRAASDRAAALIAELGGGVVDPELYDCYPRPSVSAVIPFRPAHCCALLGVELPPEEQAAYLRRLGLYVAEEDGTVWKVTVPTWRTDLAIEEDLIEEVGRLHGYNRLPETLPGGAAGAGRLSDEERTARRVRDCLAGQGLHEAVTNTLVASALLDRCRIPGPLVARDRIDPLSSGASPRVRNPLGEEWDTLRPSLLPGLLLALRHNLRRGARDVFLFECGRIHGLDNFGEPAETPAVAGLLVGSRWSRAWNPPTDADVDFFGAKHVVECLAHVAGIDALEAEPQRLPTFHPGRTALLRAGGRPLGVIGELHPDVARNLDLPRGVYLFELDAVALLSRSGASRRFAPPSRYPRALRDLAVVVDRAVPAAAVRAAISEGMGEWAVEVRLFDVYRGHPLPESRVSLGFAIEIGAQDRTLTDEEVDGRVEETRALLRHRFDASFRS